MESKNEQLIKRGLAVHNFQTELKMINNIIYKPNQFTIKSIHEERQNSDYAAGTFELATKRATKTIRFRVAKITPNKIGQFVTFWEKDTNGINQSYEYNEAPDLLIITVFKDNDTFGQFLFPKDVLLNKNILRSETTKGKMGIRVYPSWDKPANKTAIKTQEWQLRYFFVVTDRNALPIEQIISLYR